MADVVPSIGGGSEKECGRGYSLVSAVHAGLALPLLVRPDVASSFLFTPGTIPAGETQEALSRVLAGNLLLGAAVSGALANAAFKGDLSSRPNAALQLGLAAAGVAAGAVVAGAAGGVPGVSAVLSRDGATLAGSAVALTAAVPLISILRRPSAFDRLVESIHDSARKVLAAVAPGRNVTVRGAVYGLAAPVLLVAGASATFGPARFLGRIFGGLLQRPSDLFLARTAGALLGSVGPAVALTLQAAAEENAIAQCTPRTLNAGLLGAAVAHLVALGPVALDRAGTAGVDAAVGVWGALLLTSLAGLHGAKSGL